MPSDRTEETVSRAHLRHWAWFVALVLALASWRKRRRNKLAVESSSQRSLRARNVMAFRVEYALPLVHGDYVPGAMVS